VERGGHVRVRRFGERRCGGRVVGSVVFIRNLEGLVGVAGARFRGGGFMRFMPAISVCRDCSEGIGEGGRLASLREREGFCVDPNCAFGVCQGTAALVSSIEGTSRACSLRLKHSSSGATVETVSGDFSVGGLRLGWLSRHRHRMGTVRLTDDRKKTS